MARIPTTNGNEELGSDLLSALILISKLSNSALDRIPLNVSGSAPLTLAPVTTP